MTEKTYNYYDEHGDLTLLLVGHKVIGASIEDATLTLDNGTKIRFDRENSDCCSSIDLTALHTTDNIITSAEFRDNEDETGGEGEYKSVAACCH